MWRRAEFRPLYITTGQITGIIARRAKYKSWSQNLLWLESHATQWVHSDFCCGCLVVTHCWFKFMELVRCQVGGAGCLPIDWPDVPGSVGKCHHFLYICSAWLPSVLLLFMAPRRTVIPDSPAYILYMFSGGVKEAWIRLLRKLQLIRSSVTSTGKFLNVHECPRAMLRPQHSKQVLVYGEGGVCVCLCVFRRGTDTEMIWT